MLFICYNIGEGRIEIFYPSVISEEKRRKEKVMEKITERNYRFEGKEKDFSKTFDFRIQATEKRNLDVIDEFAGYDEETTFEIYQGEELKTSFTRQDYLADNVDLTLKQGASICKKLHVIEDIMQLAKNEKTDKIVNAVMNRLVKITF